MDLLISEHEPRKGTETKVKGLSITPLRLISEHEPRKGTETVESFAACSLVGRENFRTRTPKGDGNLVGRQSLELNKQANFRTRTPKGDGNSKYGLSKYQYWADFRTRTPKGDGNPMTVASSSVASSLFQNTNPERGRKQRRGGRNGSYCLHFRTRTPKGDGNTILRPAGRFRGYSISEHEPRKGPETGQ